jgi:hypothetical protein
MSIISPRDKIWEFLLKEVFITHIDPTYNDYNFNKDDIDWVIQNILTAILNDKINREVLYLSVILTDRSGEFGKYAISWNYKIDTAISNKNVNNLIELYNKPDFIEIYENEYLNESEKSEIMKRLNESAIALNIAVSSRIKTGKISSNMIDSDFHNNYKKDVCTALDRKSVDKYSKPAVYTRLSFKRNGVVYSYFYNIFSLILTIVIDGINQYTNDKYGDDVKNIIRKSFPFEVAMIRKGYGY